MSAQQEFALNYYCNLWHLFVLDKNGKMWVWAATRAALNENSIT